MNPAQNFSCSGVRFSSFLIRSILASLLLTICSAVICGAPGWVRTAGCCDCCLAVLVALLPFAGFAASPCLEESPCLEDCPALDASPCLASLAAGACPLLLLLLPPVKTPVTPKTTPTTPPI